MEKIPRAAALLSCLSCRYFDTVSKIHEAQQITVCRFRPPTPFAAVVPTPQGAQWITTAAWPPVNSSDWCGDHNPRLSS